MENFFSTTIGMIILLILALNAVLWFFIPFAVFGIKKRLDEANRINGEICGYLKKLQTREYL